MTFALTLTMTTLGLQRFTAAQLGGDIDLRIAEVGFTDAAFVTAPTLTALPGEFRRVATISGDVVGDNVVHMIVRDDATLRYQARGFGLFLADGTLFAIYGQADRIVEKAAAATLLFAIDVAFPTTDIAAITFGNANFLNPPATTERSGVVELATLGEANAGTDENRVAPVSVMKSAIDAAIAALRALRVQGGGMIKGGGTLTADCILTLDAATNEETRAGERGDVVVTPLSLRVADFVRIDDRDHSPAGYRIGSDGFKDCWGAANVAAGITADVSFPVEHEEWASVIGGAWNEQDSAPVSIVEMIFPAVGQPPTGFRVRNSKTAAVTFHWHSKGV